MFHFTRYVVYEKHPFYVFGAIEARRAMSLRRGNEARRLVRRSQAPPKYGQLLYRIARFCKCRTILELGTSSGITTAYLAAADRHARCLTMERSPEMARLARENLRALQLDNVQLVEGDIDDRLADVLHDAGTLDLIYIDAGRCADALLARFGRCLEHLHGGSVVVVRGICDSRGMEQAWKRLQNHERVTSSIDLWEMGILFFNPDLHRKNYRMMI